MMYPGLKKLDILDSLFLFAGPKFKINFHEAKCKFYCSFNSLCSKLGQLLDPNVITYLLQTIAIPVLTYAIEGLFLNKTELSSLEFTLNRAIIKIFKITEQENITYCKTLFGIRNITEIYNTQKNKFLNKIKASELQFMKILCDSSA